MEWKTFGKRSFLHAGCNNLLPKELFCTATVSWRGWKELDMMDANLSNILLSPTTSTASRVQPRTEPAPPTSLLSLFLSLSANPQPQQTTALNDRWKKWQMQQQCHKRPLTVACTSQKNSIFSAKNGDDFGPSCSGHLCYVTSPVYCWGKHPGICTLIPPRCSLVQSVVPYSWSLLSITVSFVLLLVFIWRWFFFHTIPQSWWWPPPPVLQLIPLCITANNGCVIRELLETTTGLAGSHWRRWKSKKTWL